MSPFRFISGFNIAPAPSDPKEESEEPPLQRCYDCGQSSTRFTTVYYPYSGDYDVECLECGSTHTAPDGEGEPQHCSKHYGWTCAEHQVVMCPGCWQWKPWPTPEEPEDFTCEDCS